MYEMANKNSQNGTNISTSADAADADANVATTAINIFYEHRVCIQML